jgi:hypothetical protein
MKDERAPLNYCHTLTYYFHSLPYLFLRALSTNISLHELIIYNQIKVSQPQSVIGFCHMNQTLSKLKLNLLQDEIVSSLFEGLKDNKSIKELDLSGNYYYQSYYTKAVNGDKIILLFLIVI